jgi:hypothetical protein
MTPKARHLKIKWKERVAKEFGKIMLNFENDLVRFVMKAQIAELRKMKETL